MASKPNWQNAPEWAQWLSQDWDGQWCWWELEPKIHSECHWFEWDGREQYVFAAKYRQSKNWCETLEPRP